MAMVGMEAVSDRGVHVWIVEEWLSEARMV
jgi:hypothetical protein